MKWQQGGKRIYLDHKNEVPVKFENLKILVKLEWVVDKKIIKMSQNGDRKSDFEILGTEMQKIK